MKILVADDSEVFRTLLAAKLEDLGHSVTMVDSGLSAWEELTRNHYSVLISDWMMPGKDGPSLCRAIRESFGLNYIYIILITSLSGEHDYRDGIDAGADDFMSKPFDVEHLKSRLHAAARILALHEELRERAFRDRLTGLLNRGAILDALDRELHSAARDDRGLAIFLVDVDHFKRVNDTYGHAAGDDVLQEAALRMERNSRPSDRVGRYGGEEFLMVAPCENAKDAHAIAERIRSKIADEPIRVGVADIDVTVSVGVVGTHSEGRGDTAALVAVADEALYRAKNAGRNRVEVVDCFSGRHEYFQSRCRNSNELGPDFVLLHGSFPVSEQTAASSEPIDGQRACAIARDADFPTSESVPDRRTRARNFPLAAQTTAIAVPQRRKS